MCRALLPDYWRDRGHAAITWSMFLSCAPPRVPGSGLADFVAQCCIAALVNLTRHPPAVSLGAFAVLLVSCAGLAVADC